MGPFSFVTPTCSADGYGCSGENLALAAVRDHGAQISVSEYPWADKRFCEPEFVAMLEPEYVPLQHATVVVYFLPYALPRFRGRKATISQTMWETDRIPDAWASLLGKFADGVIVPSESCRSVFAERVDKPIEVVPYGTDPELYTYCDRSDQTDPFVFLMSGILHYRKGVDLALRAFAEEFDRSEPVELWLKSRQTFLDVGDQRHVLADPRVAIITDDYSRAQMATMYQQADCLLAPSRGEGSGLTPRDAMATGLPVIVTDWGGLSELCDDRYTYPLRVDDLERVPPDNSSYAPGITLGSDVGNMARPSVTHLRQLMREVYEDRAAARERGRAAADWIRREWTWEHCAWKWLRAVERLGAGVAA